MIDRMAYEGGQGPGLSTSTGNASSDRDAELSRLRARVAELEEAINGIRVVAVCEGEGYDCSPRMAIGEIINLASAVMPMTSRSGLVTVERDRLREIEWASVQADGHGGWWNVCPICGQPEVSGHAPGCWLGAACAGQESARCPTCNGVGCIPETVPGDGGCRELSGGEVVCPTCRGTGRACKEEA